MKIGIIGVGNLGKSIALGILNEKEVDCEHLFLADKDLSLLDSWKSRNRVSTTYSNVEVAEKADVIILAIQPAHLPGVLEELKGELNDNHTIISVVTGRTIEYMESVVGGEVAIIRAMPNTAVSVSHSMTCISANDKALDKVEVAKAIFNPLGKAIHIEDRLMQSATVVCASGIAFWMRLIRASTEGAVQLGFDAEDAKELSLQTCLGAVSLLMESGNNPETEIDKVTTPSGCTIEGLNEMEHHGMSSSFIKGLVASYNKINKI